MGVAPHNPLTPTREAPWQPLGPGGGMAPILRLLSGEILEVGEARSLQEMGVFKIRWKKRHW